MATFTVLAEIDREHAEVSHRVAELDRLLACVRGEGACYVCDAHEACCSTAINDFCEQLLEFMQEHFQREESAMWVLQAQTPQLKDRFDAHREHHADLSQALSESICRGPQPVKAYQDLRRILVDWLESHVPQHDALLGQALRLQAG